MEKNILKLAYEDNPTNTDFGVYCYHCGTILTPHKIIMFSTHSETEWLCPKCKVTEIRRGI